MNKSYAKINLIITTILLLILAICSGYEIGQAKRETMLKERELQELKNEFRNYKK